MPEVHEAERNIELKCTGEPLYNTNVKNVLFFLRGKIHAALFVVKLHLAYNRKMRLLDALIRQSQAVQ